MENSKSDSLASDQKQTFLTSHRWESKTVSTGTCTSPLFNELRHGKGTWNSHNNSDIWSRFRRSLKHKATINLGNPTRFGGASIVRVLSGRIFTFYFRFNFSFCSEGLARLAGAAMFLISCTSWPFRMALLLSLEPTTFWSLGSSSSKWTVVNGGCQSL